ncbi:SprB repeat-containing protein [Flavobacteriales bacterium]|nr:SprB repeat-containing protein [Flavobacteriales bacterium]
MKKQLLFVVTMVASFLFVINVNAQTIGSMQTNNPLCSGDFSGDVTVNITQPSSPDDLAVKLWLLNPANGFWVNLGTSYYNSPSFILTHSFPNLGAGDYRVDIIDDATGFIIVDDFFTLVDPPQLENNFIVTNALCFGGATGTIATNTSGGTPYAIVPFYNYLWSNFATTDSISNLNSGTYSVDVTDANGCIVGSTAFVGQPNQIVTSGSVSQVILGAGNSNGEITAQASGGNGSFNYSINGGAYSTNPIFTALNAGTYTISYQDLEGCVASEDITLQDPLPLNGYISILNQVSCNGDCDGKIEFVNNSTSNGPFTYILNGSVTQIDNPVFDNLCGDSVYTIIVMDTMNGSFTATIYLGEPSLLTYNTVTQDINGYGVTCSWGCDGAITINTVTGGSGSPITYSFDGGVTFGQIWALSNLCPGDHFIAVKDASGCVTHDTVSFTAPDSLQTSFVVNDISCNGLNDGAINLTVSGGFGPYTYLWSTGEITEDISNLAVGTYSVTVTDANGCVINTLVTLSEPNILTSSFSIQNNFMPYDSNAVIITTILGGTPPYQYSWVGPNNFTSDKQDITNLYSGIYYLTTTDTNGCVRVDTIEIIEPGVIFGCTDSTALNYNSVANTNNGTCYYCALNYSLYSSNPSTQFNCDGWLSAYVPNNFNYPISYFWSTGAPVNDWLINTLCNDTFSLTLVDANGCGADTTVLLSDYVGCMDSSALNFNSTAMFDDGSCIPFIYGCTDSLMSNYNNSANTDDGSCVPYVLGCLDTLAINYNAEADTSDGSCCFISGCMDSTMLNYSVLNCIDTEPGDSCIPFIYGCTDENAANFVATANTDDNSCWYCVDGCMDPTMFNYDSLASCNDSCIPFIYGCTDSSAWNYNTIANTNDSSCIATVYGCTDPMAYNYYPGANLDDGSCYNCSFSTPTWYVDTTSIDSCNAYAGIQIYSLNPGPLSYFWNVVWGPSINIPSMPYSNSLCRGIYTMTITDINGCILIDTIEVGNVVLGCTDSTAQNYNAAANIDDGSCCSAPVVDLTIGQWHFEYGWSCPAYDTLYYINYASNGTWSNSYSGEWELCGDQYTHTYYNDPTVYTGSYNNGVITGTMNDGISTTFGCFLIYLDSSTVVLGCMDTLACNYDSTAQVSDGSCLIDYGCMDPLSTNYDPLATCDDGSCIVIVYGCTDPLALNYYAGANTNDGSCTYSTTCSNSSITGLFISGIIDDEVLANFDNMNTYDATGAQICRVDQIRIRYREVGISAWSFKNIASPTGYDPITGVCNSSQKTDKLIRNLTAATEYEWEVKVWYCNGGIGAWTIGQY